MTKIINSKNGVFNFKKIFDLLLLLIPLGAIINIIVALIFTPPNIEKDFQVFSVPIFFVAMILSIFPWLTHTLRIIIWGDYFRQKIHFRDALQTVLGTELASAITPTAVGGGYLKIFLLIKKGMTPAQALSVNFFGVLEDLIFFAVALPIAFSLSKVWKLPVLNRILEQLDVKLIFPVLSIAILILLFSFLFLIFQKLLHKKSFLWKKWVLTPFSRVKNLFASKGKITKHQINGNVQLVRENTFDKLTKVVLIHHHFNKYFNGELKKRLTFLQNIEGQSMKLRKSKKIVDLFQKMGVKLVLHGHLHTSEQYSKNGLSFLNAGGCIDGNKPGNLKINFILLDKNKIETETRSISISRKKITETRSSKLLTRDLVSTEPKNIK